MRITPEGNVHLAPGYSKLLGAPSEWTHPAVPQVEELIFGDDKNDQGVAAAYEQQANGYADDKEAALMAARTSWSEGHFAVAGLAAAQAGLFGLRERVAAHRAHRVKKIAQTLLVARDWENAS